MTKFLQNIIETWRAFMLIPLPIEESWVIGFNRFMICIVILTVAYKLPIWLSRLGLLGS